MAQGKPRTQQPYDPSRPLSQQIELPRISLEDQIFIAKHQKKNAGGGSILGKIWNAPNTALGLLYGGLGYVAGKAMGTDPHISIGGNAIEFTNNPFGGVGAITLGNTTTYSPGLSPNDVDPETGVPVWEHEKQHTYQGEVLGPLYLPSNLIGGLSALLFDRDKHGDRNWHGEHNWNETGPQMNPPKPWP